MIRWLDRVRGLSGWRRLALALVAGLMTALALPPYGFWPCLPIGAAVFVLLLDGTATRAASFTAGWVYGLGYFTFAFHWIGFAFLVEADTYLWMMPFMVGGLSAGMAIYWGLAALAARDLRRLGFGLVLAFPACLAVAEWLRGHLFTGFPWAAPGLAADGMGSVAQVASLIGMTGLTLVLTAMGSALLLLTTGPSRRERALALALMSLLPLTWWWGEQRLAARANAGARPFSVRIVQPNVPQQQKWREDNGRNIFDSLKTLSATMTVERPDGLASIDYLVWPESAVPFLIDESDVAKDELAGLLAGRTALITGSLRSDGESAGDRRIYNSMIVFDGSGQPVARYDKWRLVPGGEFLPFEWLLEPLGFRKVVTVPGSFAAGPGPLTLALPGGLRAAMLVCYEVIFPHGLVDPEDRPQVLINVTNDGWFGQSTGPYQHLAQARLRSIEQGLPLVRAANTGISAVIDSYGDTIAALGLGQEGQIDAVLPPPLEATIYARFGDWILAAAALLVLAFARWTRQARAS